MPDLAALAVRNARQARAARRQAAAPPPRRRTTRDFRHLAGLALDPVAMMVEPAHNPPPEMPNPRIQKMWSRAIALAVPSMGSARVLLPAREVPDQVSPRPQGVAALWDQAFARVVSPKRS